MTHRNPLGLDFGAIIQTAERRRINLQAIGDLIGAQAQPIMGHLKEVKSTLEMLDLRWEALDTEGRALLPENVRKVVGASASWMNAVAGVMGETYIGWKDMLPYAELPAPTAEVKVGTSEYTVKIAIKTVENVGFLVGVIQTMYDEANIAGRFIVEGSSEASDQNPWRWITFTRELGDDAGFIQERMSKTNFHMTAAQAACQQIMAEFLDYSQDNTWVDIIVAALNSGEVRFPPPPLPK